MTNTNSVSLRDLFNAVLDSDFPQELKDRAAAEIAKLDKENEKRRQKNAAKAAERQPLLDEITSLLSADETKTASTIKSELSTEVSVQLVSSMLRKLENDGFVASEEVKIVGKGKCKGYKLI